MRRSLFLSALALLLMAVPGAPAMAQTTYSFHPESTIEIDGTSNKSDWTVTATAFTGSFTLNDDEPVAADVSVPVMQMEGGKSLIMDRLMRNTLNAEEYPEIHFESTSIASSDSGWSVTGKLTISGETREVKVPVRRTDIGGFAGEVPLKMTDFNLKPPTAMFGALRTADEITVRINVMAGEEIDA